MGRSVAMLSIAVSLALAAVNIAVGLGTQSSSVLAAGLEFAGDVLASTVVLAGILVAARPADDNHPYGHGRAETLAAFVVGIILIVGGAGISYHSLQQVGVDHPVPGVLAIWAPIMSIAVRCAMSVLKLRVGRSIGSRSLVADAWNDTIDTLGAAVAIVAVGLARYDPARFLAADHYGGFAIGLVVVITGVRVVRDASFDLLDTMPDAALLERVREVALSVPGAAGVEKCFARRSGLQYQVDLHLEVDPRLTVAESHEIATTVRHRLQAELDWVRDVLVHVEPAGREPDALTRRGTVFPRS